MTAIISPSASSSSWSPGVSCSAAKRAQWVSAARMHEGNPQAPPRTRATHEGHTLSLHSAGVFGRSGRTKWRQFLGHFHEI